MSEDIQPPSVQQVHQLHKDNPFGCKNLTTQDIQDLQNMYCLIVKRILLLTTKYDLSDIKAYAEDMISDNFVFHQVPVYWACRFLEQHPQDYTHEQAWAPFNNRKTQR